MLEQDPSTSTEAPARKKGGCMKSCCLVTFGCLAILVIALGVASYLFLSTPSNPVEREYEEIPEYFDLSLITNDWTCAEADRDA